MRRTLNDKKVKCRPLFGGLIIGTWLLVWSIFEAKGFDSVKWLIGVEMN